MTTSVSSEEIAEDVKLFKEYFSGECRASNGGGIYCKECRSLTGNNGCLSKHAKEIFNIESVNKPTITSPEELSFAISLIYKFCGAVSCNNCAWRVKGKSCSKHILRGDE